MAQLNVIECVQEVAPELEVLGLCDMEGLQQTDIRIRITRSSLRSLQWAIAKASSRWFRISGCAQKLIALERSLLMLA